MKSDHVSANGKNAKETVLSFIRALNEEDFEAAREYVSDELTFIGVLGTRVGADAYFQDMERMKFKYVVKKAIAEEENVCLLYDIKMGNVSVFASGWYYLMNGKINTFNVLFDPRPVLENT